MPYHNDVIGSKEGSAVDGQNLENLRVFSWSASDTLRLQGTVFLGWDPLGLRQKSDEDLPATSCVTGLAMRAFILVNSDGCGAFETY